jgi:hypothetical protein
MGEDEELLWVITAEESEEQPAQIDGAKGNNPYDNPYETPTRSVSGAKGVALKVADVEHNMSRFMKMVGRIFARAEKQIEPNSDLQLDEITLSVEIGGDGEVKLLGTGIKASSKGAIGLKFKRKGS